MSERKKNWKTTTVGILAGLSLIFVPIIAALDSDPETVFSLEPIFAGLAAMGIGWFARDKDVSSKSSGVE